MQVIKSTNPPYVSSPCSFGVCDQVSKKILGDLHLAAFNRCAAEVCRDFGAELKECDGEADHVHMLIEYGPTVAVICAGQLIETVTSRRLRNEFWT